MKILGLFVEIFQRIFQGIKGFLDGVLYFSYSINSKPI